MNFNKGNDFCLESSGLKKTKQRQAIVDILNKAIQPLTADDIYIELKNVNISISLSTIYRILDVMTEKKIIVKLNVSNNNKALFEINQMIHKHYLSCLVCKKIISVNFCPMGDYEADLEKETGYEIIGHKLEIFGYCKECRKDKIS
jgi:Fur family transcriptional regulator, ferric uptake regulator